MWSVCNAVQAPSPTAVCIYIGSKQINTTLFYLKFLINDIENTSDSNSTNKDCAKI